MRWMLLSKPNALTTPPSISKESSRASSSETSVPKFDDTSVLRYLRYLRYRLATKLSETFFRRKTLRTETGQQPTSGVFRFIHIEEVTDQESSSSTNFSASRFLPYLGHPYSFDRPGKWIPKQLNLSHRAHVLS